MSGFKISMFMFLLLTSVDAFANCSSIAGSYKKVNGTSFSTSDSNFGPKPALENDIFIAQNAANGCKTTVFLGKKGEKFELTFDSATNEFSASASVNHSSVKIKRITVKESNESEVDVTLTFEFRISSPTTTGATFKKRSF